MVLWRSPSGRYFIILGYLGEKVVRTQRSEVTGVTSKYALCMHLQNLLWVGNIPTLNFRNHILKLLLPITNSRMQLFVENKTFPMTDCVTNDCITKLLFMLKMPGYHKTIKQTFPLTQLISS